MHRTDADEPRRSAANGRLTAQVETDSAAQRARVATGEELAALLHHEAADVLLVLLNNPALTDSDICVLLQRRGLPGEVLEGICQRREWLKTYAVKKALVRQAHTPRLVSLRLLRELYLMDLVQIAQLPGVPAEMQRGAEEQLAARLPQLPLGQKITLARRGPARVAGLLLAEGHPHVVPIALENVHLTAAQILKVLAREGVSEAVVLAIAQHRKWSTDYHVRLALVRNPGSTLASVLAFLPELTVADLRELAAPGIVPHRLRNYLDAEVRRRIRAGQRLANRDESVVEIPPPKND
jgi:hypothetical protein